MKRTGLRDRLLIKRIRLDGGTQPRVEMDQALIDEYAACLDALPPILVMFDDKRYWLVDGFHRLKAHLQASRKEILVEVRKGTRREAVLLSLGVNAAHGLRRTNADIRRAVETMLGDHEWSQWSDRQIAEHCAVHHQTVANHRKALEGEANNGPARAGEVRHPCDISELPEEWADAFHALTPEAQVNYLRDRERAALREQSKQDARTWLERVESTSARLGALLSGRPEIKAADRKRAVGWLERIVGLARKYERGPTVA